MAFNTKVIKKSKKSQDMEEMEPEEMSFKTKSIPLNMSDLKTKSIPVDISSLKSATVPKSEIGTIKKISEYNKPMKGADSLKLDAMIAAAAKKKLPVKASMEKEVEISPMKEEKKPTEFVQHGGSMLQYLKKKK